MTDMFTDPAISYLAGKVAGYFGDEPSGHGWDHALRVWRNAVYITGFHPRARRRVVEASALVHDVIDRKMTDNPKAAAETVRKWMQQAGLSADQADAVETIIRNISFRGEGEEEAALSIEGQIVQDADRLDAMGAIGIARAFTYGGHYGRKLYDPAAEPERGMTEAAYFGRKGSTINHFHEKLLLLKDRMQTPQGRQLAMHRHEIMLEFLSEFHNEWHGIFNKPSE